MLQTLTARLREDDGGTAAEYAILAALIAVAIVATVYLIGVGVDGLFSRVVIPS